MKLGIFSDIHLEFADWDFEPEDGVFYICAGDIHPYEDVRERFIEKHADHMFYIYGNHDFYGHSFDDAMNSIMVQTKDGIRIHGAPLWTDLSDQFNWYLFQGSMSDARLIQDLTHEKMINVHNDHRKFLTNPESTADIVVSHHTPSQKSIAEVYRGDLLNVCFSNDMDDEIMAMTKRPQIWIHGHTHHAFDYMIGDTRVICHPRGYPGERPWFKDYKPLVIEI